jgi:hypothetical protein
VSFTIRLRAFGRWLFGEGKPGWVAVAFPALAMSTVWIRYGPGDDMRVRIAGFLLSLLGVGLVAIDIRAKTRAFKKPSLIARVRAWVSRRPPLLSSQGTTVNLGAAAAGGSSRLSGTLTTRAPRTTLDERVAGLEEDVRKLRDELSKTTLDIRTEADRRARDIEETRRASATAVGALSSQIEDLSVGGLNFEAVGVVWVMVGTFVSTFPDLVASWLL